MSKRIWLSWSLILVLCLGLVVPAGAEGDYNFIEGGTTVDMEGKFSFTIPENMAFLNKEDTIKLEQEMKNIPTMLEIGSVVPYEEDWIVYMEYEETGHIKDEDQNEINADELLESYKLGTEEANEQREPHEQFHVVGWNVAPNYNAATHELEYSMLLENAQKEKFLNYKLQLLTRTGNVSFVLVTDLPNLERDKKTLREVILKNFTVKEGHRYADFDPKTDEVAEYGLSGLILGGLGLAAAKKLGFLAILLAFLKKGWILIVVVIGALFKFGGKLFRKKAPADSQQADSLPDSNSDNQDPNNNEKPTA